MAANAPRNVINFKSSYAEAVRKQRDGQQEAIMAPDPDDAIMTDMKWLVAKACVILGSVERAEAVLMNRLAMALSAKKLSKGV